MTTTSPQHHSGPSPSFGPSPRPNTTFRGSPFPFGAGHSTSPVPVPFGSASPRANWSPDPHYARGGTEDTTPATTPRPRADTTDIENQFLEKRLAVKRGHTPLENKTLQRRLDEKRRRRRRSSKKRRRSTTPLEHQTLGRRLRAMLDA